MAGCKYAVEELLRWPLPTLDCDQPITLIRVSIPVYLIERMKRTNTEHIATTHILIERELRCKFLCCGNNTIIERGRKTGKADGYCPIEPMVCRDELTSSIMAVGRGNKFLVLSTSSASILHGGQDDGVPS